MNVLFLNKKPIKWGAFLTFLLIFLFAFTSCNTSAAEKYLGFRQDEIRATLQCTLTLKKSDGYEEHGACAGIGSDKRVIRAELDVRFYPPSADGRGDMQMCFISPLQLCGLTIKKSESGYKISQKDLEYDYSGEFLPIIDEIYDIFYNGCKIENVSPLPDVKVELRLSQGGKDTQYIYIYEKSSSLPIAVKGSGEFFDIDISHIEWGKTVQSGD